LVTPRAVRSFTEMIKDMTKQEFLEKWQMPEFMIETNTDFKMMLLSNISDIQESGDMSKLDIIKEFISDFYNAQPSNVGTHWF
jgi:hypothetical protein